MSRAAVIANVNELGHLVARSTLRATSSATCIYHQSDKKLSYCWETVRRESMTRIAEMDVEMTT